MCRFNGAYQKITRYAGSEIIDDLCTGGVNCLQSEQIQSIDYRHNAWGNVEGEAHQHNGLDYAYTYDKLHRLDTQTVTSSDYPQFDRSVDYDYDAVGNLKIKSDYATSLQYGNPTRTAGGNAGPHAVRQVTTTDGQSHNLVYDNAGNLITGINGLSVDYDNYNQANRIERNGIVTEYRYGTGIDAYKKIETEGTNTTTTLYVGNFEQITESDGTEKERLTYGGYLVITRENQTTEQSILLKDRLGSVTTIVDAEKQPGESGFVKQYRSYDPFGQSRDFQGQDHITTLSTTDQGFTGHRHLNDQKLIHMRGRVYDYQLGRFLSPDPYILDPQDSQSLNAYSYVLNNPLSGTDPTGYQYNTGQKPNTRSPAEATPDTEEGQRAQKDKLKTVTGKTIDSRTKKVTSNFAATVDGNGDVQSIVQTDMEGQSAVFTAGEGWSKVSGQSVNAASTGVLPWEATGSLLGIGARFLTSLLGMSTLLTSSSYDNPDDYITVYRGSNLTTELQIHSETGVVMSGAAQDKYMEITNMRLHENGSLSPQDYVSAAGQAGVHAVRRHAELVAKYGGEQNLAREQTLQGDRFPDKPRSMFSVTTDINRARYFARGGAVFSAKVNKHKLIQTPVRSSTEQEYFIRAQIRMERIE